MVRRNLFLALSLVLVMVLPALAGDYEKCQSSTQDCLNHMAAKLQSSGFVGIEYEVNEDTGVVTVERVVPGSPAEEAGLKAGDQLFALNGVGMSEENHKKLAKAKKDWAPGQEITYTIKRGGYEKATHGHSLCSVTPSLTKSLSMNSSPR